MHDGRAVVQESNLKPPEMAKYCRSYAFSLSRDSLPSHMRVFEDPHAVVAEVMNGRSRYWAVAEDCFSVCHLSGGRTVPVKDLECISGNKYCLRHPE
jgi:hypothetical protein